MQKVLLIAMPWARVDMPSIQLGTLSAYLRQRGIDVECRYYYLKLADMLGLDVYRLLSAGPFDATVLYSELLFEKKEFNYRKFLSEERSFLKQTRIDCEALLKTFRRFHQEVLAELESQLDNFDIIGFTIGYAQEIPSLCLARAIKRKYPDKFIVFGGSCCYADLGENLITNYDYIDAVVSGEGENTLLELVTRVRANQSLVGLPGTFCRNHGEIIHNPARPLIDSLDELPLPHYDEYFRQYAQYPDLAAQNPYTMVTLPIETSRGCWWNRCAFCGLNRQFVDPAGDHSFRPKSIARVIQELEHLVKQYPAKSLQFMDNVQFNSRELCQAILATGADYTFFTESRANLTPTDAYYLSEAGFSAVQIGIESFSTSILRKMSKGITAIENVTVLKWCKFFNIKPYYNLLTHFPLETTLDIAEEIALIKKIGHLDPPSGTPCFILAYDSPIYRDPAAYNVGERKIPERYKYIYPRHILEKLVLPNLAYETVTSLDTEEAREKFHKLIQTWRENKSATLYYYDYGDFLKVTDLRNGETNAFILEGLKRELYLYCNCLRTKDELTTKFANLSADSLDCALAALIALDLLITEDDRYLTLALPGTPHGRKALIQQLEV